MKSNISFDKKKKSNFFGSKGLYALLAICLCAALGTTFWTVNKSLTNSKKDPFISQAGEENAPESQNPHSSSQPSIEDTSSVQSSEDSGNSEEQENSKQEQSVSTETSPEFYIMPVVGSLITDFSDHKVVKNETLGDWRTHDGIDIKASATTPVKCVTDGVVKEIYEDNLLGTVVVVEHSGNLESYYCNLNKVVNVSVGQQLTIGHVIGSVGATAISESASEEHLHFAMKKDGEWVDPIETMGVKQ